MKMQFRKLQAVVASGVLLLAALACNAPSGNNGGLETATALALTGTQVAQLPTGQSAASITPQTGVTASATTQSQQPTATATINVPTVASGVTPTATNSCNFNSQFQSDVTIPDDTPIVTGQTFTKTWRIKNNGCAPWPNGTTLVFISGEHMAGPASVSVPLTSSGGVQDISVNLTAPTTPGTYRGDWRLKKPDGVLFGDTIYVKINSVAPSPTPTNTPVPATATPTQTLAPVDFTATFVKTFNCTPYVYMSAQITNTGSLTIESASIKAEGPVGTDATGGGYSNTPFKPAADQPVGDCIQAGASTLASGATAYLYKNTSSVPASGTAGKMTITVCTADGMAGTCVTKSFNFNWP